MTYKPIPEQPTPDDIADLQHRNADYFAAWLKGGLRSLIQFARTGAEAFEGGAGPFIGWMDDRTSELDAVYRALRLDKAQAAFAEGCASALSDMRFDGLIDALIARELLKLGARIHASKVLERFADLSHTWFGPHDGIDLLSTALDAARSLARPDETGQLAASVLHLTRNSNFRPVQARSALITLCTISPDDLVSHLRDLARPLGMRYGRIENAADEEAVRLARRRTLILEVAGCVKNSVVLALSVRPETRLPWGTLPRGSDVDNDWWTHTWLRRDDPIIATLYDDRIRPNASKVAALSGQYDQQGLGYSRGAMNISGWQHSSLVLDDMGL